ncbi:MAG: hypothetical protein ACOCG5_06585 [Candidatus Alkaliphilus sp. MAG34]
MEKTKIVVDTNIFVSAFLGSKNAKLLIKEIINGIQNCPYGISFYLEIYKVD